MEGDFYFGEHVRWNLGWGNPNQAGAFIAMLIPWLWGLGFWLLGRDRKGWVWIVLAVELGMWFLVCKTFSRGALVAGVVSGVAFWFWRSRLDCSWRLKRLQVARLVGIAVLLLATDFFARIDPRFVTQDASAGNRLVLWKGGLQMIAVSPWNGWGVGQSGYCFSQWFQPLEAKERYLGMVNSFLHVAVERGLPVLAVVLWLAGGLLGAAYRATGRGISGTSTTCLAPAALTAAAVSLFSFLIANVFSTLWIFKNLWWVPGINSIVIVSLAWLMLKPRILMEAMKLAASVGLLSLAAVGCLFGMGKVMERDLHVSITGGSVGVSVAQSPVEQVLFFPDPSVLGDEWGKEIRRLALTEKFQEMQICTPLRNYGDDVHSKIPVAAPSLIVACGSRFPEGLKAKEAWPEARLVLVHPVGPPEFTGPMPVKALILLPMLDTRNTARPWKAAASTNGWQWALSPGVGQDARLAWPQVLVDALR